MRGRTAAAAVSAALLMTGCGVTAPSPAASTSGPVDTASAPRTSSAPSSIAPTTSVAPAEPSPSADRVTACVQQRVDEMSLKARVGQLFMIGVTSGAASEVATLRRNQIGSAILMGRSPVGVAGVKAIVTRVRKAEGDTPLLVAADQEGGLVQRLKGRGFDTIPSARTQSQWSDARLRSAAARWGRQLRAAGVLLDLAPVADVVPAAFASQNAPIGRLKRGYGSDPATVSAKVTAVIEGFRDAGVAASVKHFPGIGRVRGNTDFAANVVDSLTSADDPTLRPFLDAAQAGVASVMISTVTYARIDPKNQAVYSRKVVDLIRKTGYQGVLITDDVGAAVSLRHVPVRERGVRFIAAGGDLVINVSPGLTDAMVAGVLARAKKDQAFAAQVGQAAIRVVRMKADLGLLTCG